jgi:hypothetical protein
VAWTARRAAEGTVSGPISLPRVPRCFRQLGRASAPMILQPVHPARRGGWGYRSSVGRPQTHNPVARLGLNLAGLKIYDVRHCQARHEGHSTRAHLEAAALVGGLPFRPLPHGRKRRRGDAIRARTPNTVPPVPTILGIGAEP